MATLTAIGNEFRVDGPGSTAGQSFTAMADLRYGGFASVWVSGSNEDGNGFGIFGRLFDNNGNAIASQFQINAGGVVNGTGAFSSQLFPTVTGLSGGSYVVAWQSFHTGDNDIFFQRIGADGTLLGGQVLANTTDTAPGEIQQGPSVFDRGTGFLVTWSHSPDNGITHDIRGRIYDADGVAAGNDFLINATTAGIQAQQSAATLTDGKTVVVWQSEGPGQEGAGDYGIYARFINADGTLTAPEIHVNTTTAGAQYSPSAAALTGGGFVVTWTSENQDSPGTLGVYGQVFDSAGGTVGGQFLISETVLGDQGTTSVTGLSDGGFAVAWSSITGTADIYVRRFTSTGVADSSEVVVNQTAGAFMGQQPVFGGSTFSRAPDHTIAQLEDGSLVVNWYRGNDAWARRFDLDLEANASPDVDLNGADGNGIGYATAYTEGTPVSIADADVDVTDDGATITSATITLTNRQAGDLLQVNGGLPGLIVSSGYDSGTGVLTLSGSGTHAEYEQALQQVQFNTGDAPVTSPNRQVSVVLNDGSLSGATSTTTITVAAVNDLPVIDLNGADAGEDFTNTYTEDSSGVSVLDSDATLTDPDDAQLVSATVTITNPQAGDVLAVNGGSFGLTVSYDSGTGVLTLTGAQPVANYLSALKNVVFRSISDDPDETARDITVVVNDGDGNSNTAHTTMNVVAADGDGILQLADIGVGFDGFVIYGTGGPINLGSQDRSGWSVSTAGDIDGDGFEDVLVGAPFAYLGYGGLYEGATFVVFGKAGGFTSVELDDIETASSADGIYLYAGGSYSGSAGSSVGGLGDFNGDGFDDFASGAPAKGPYAGHSFNDGQAYVLFGDGARASGDAGDLAGSGADRGFVISSSSTYTSNALGWTVSGAGDINGDGLADLIVAAKDTNSSAGEHYLIFGASGADQADIDVSSLGARGFTIMGAAADQAGSSLPGRIVSGAGDVDGDGYDELLVGARGNDVSYLLFGRSTGFTDIDLTALTPGQGITIAGESGSDQSGVAVANAGDLNGDGFRDMIVGAHYADASGINAGAAYVVFGTGGAPADIDLADIAANDGGFRIEGASANDFAGEAVAAAGDVNGDGYDDVIIGSRNANGVGTAYVIFGKAGGVDSFTNVALSTLTAADGFQLRGVSTFDFAGGAVSGAGDVNGDGYDDIVVGANGAIDSSGGADGGQTYVVFGSATIGESADHVTHQGTSADETVTGTGGDDVMIGGQGNDVLIGSFGQDVLRGGEGDDVLSAMAGFRRVDGGTGDDALLLSADTTLIDADFRSVSQIDRIQLGNAVFNLTLGAIASHALEGRSVVVESGSATLAAGVIDGSALDEMLDVDVSSTTLGMLLIGGTASDSLAGGDGADRLRGGLGADTLDGGGGKDRALYTMSATAVTVDLMGIIAATGEAVGDDLDGTEGLAGSFFGDSLYGRDAEANVLSGFAGADFLDGRSGNDLLIGDGGDDTLEGGLGNDTASYAAATAGVQVSLGASGGQNTVSDGLDDLRSIENLIGGRHNDTLTGSAGVNDLRGGDGDDLIDGDDGADTLRGGSGDDTLEGGGGDDLLAGGSGRDVADYSDELTPIDFDLKTMTATTTGAGTDDLIQIEGAIGGAGADRLAGDGRNNHFVGGLGADTLNGRNGADLLDGGGGADSLLGGGGNDEIRFTAGEADGDAIIGFDGNGAGAGDEILFFGYGPTLTFTDIGGGQWEVSDGTITEVITFVDLVEPIHGNDWGAGV